MRNLTLIFAALLVLSFLSACGIQQPPKQASQIDAQVTPYLNKFLDKARENGANVDASSLTMTFSSSMPASTNGGTVVAYCQRTSSGPNVVFDTGFWASANVARREAVTFHELGHCLLGLEHDDSTEDATWYGTTPPIQVSNVPSSIMNTFLFGSSLYSGNRETYIKRLFNTSRGSLFWSAPSQIDTTQYN